MSYEKSSTNFQTSLLQEIERLQEQVKLLYQKAFKASEEANYGFPAKHTATEYCGPINQNGGSRMEDLVFLLAFVSALCFVLIIGGVIADYILPMIKPLSRWLDSLPDYEEENGQ